MQSKWTLVFIILIAIVLHAYKASQSSGISGRLFPKNAGRKVWAIQGTDSVRSIPENGAFVLEARPGVYKIVVETQLPQRDVLVEAIEVSAGKTTDLGEIKISR